jgi:hypothetical protein
VEVKMNLFVRKDLAAEKPIQDRARPHAYKAPPVKPATGHVACEICGQPPDDFLHDLPATETEPRLRWS